MQGLAQKYGCKSLVPILGIPSISYLTHIVREVVPHSRLILAIDDLSLKLKFEEVYKKQRIDNYAIYEGLPRGPVQAFYEAGSLSRTERVLILFGNQLIPRTHLEKLLSHNPKALVISGFKSLSENSCKIASVDDSFRVLDVARYNHVPALGEREIYLDVPYVAPNNFFSMETFPEIKRLFVKTPMTKVSLNKDEEVKVELAEFPAEFHFRKEIKNLETYASTFFRSFIERVGGKFND